MNDINNLLKDVKDRFWKDRIKKSIDTILSRAVKFILLRRFPDCIIVKFPNDIHPQIVSEAKLTLKEVIERQK